MKRRPVNSSRIRSVGFDGGELEIEFNNGGVYTYHGVPQEAYLGLLRAASLGRYLQDNIIGSYDYERVE